MNITEKNHSLLCRAELIRNASNVHKLNNLLNAYNNFVGRLEKGIYRENNKLLKMSRRTLLAYIQYTEYNLKQFVFNEELKKFPSLYTN